MGVRGCGSFIKYSMFLFNAVILVAGCALVGFGIYTRTNTSSLTKFSSILGSNLLPTVSLVLIITGSVIIVLSFLGCCGAIKEVKCMLIARFKFHIFEFLVHAFTFFWIICFFLLLLLIFLSFLVGGILLYAFRDRIEDITLEQLRIQLNHSYGRKGEESVTDGWNSMQTIFKCCGLSGDVNSTDSWAYYKRYTDWFQNNTEYAKKARTLSLEYVPSSCCKDQENTPNVTKCQGFTNTKIIPVAGPPVMADETNDQLYTQGCYTSFKHMINDNTKVFIGVAAGMAVAMVVGMVFAICLCKKIKDDDYYDCDD